MSFGRDFLSSLSFDAPEEGVSSPIRSGLFKGICRGVILGQKEIYNPVFLYGDPKRVSAAMDIITIGWERLHWEEPSYRTSGEAFCGDLVWAIKNGKTDDFETGLPERGLLVFEEIESLAFREITMRKFYGLFDAVYEHGGQILIGSRVPPAQLVGLDDRVLTQITSGIVFNVDAAEDMLSLANPYDVLEEMGFKFIRKRGDSDPAEHRPKRYHARIELPEGPGVCIWGDSWEEIRMQARHIQSRGARIDRRRNQFCRACLCADLEQEA